MGFFIDRQEMEQRVVICYKKVAWYYIFLFAMIVCAFLGGRFGRVSFLLSAIFFVLTFTFGVPLWRTNREVRRAMKRGDVRVSGSKYSLSNPLTFVITKPTTDEQKQ
jgi:hypothetical protein